MSVHVTDPNDPRLVRENDTTARTQAEAYLVLSEEERAKGFVRPVRQKYVHVGDQPRYPLRELTPQEREDFGSRYAAYETYPEGGAVIGRYWTQEALNEKGCGALTTMSLAIAETYARNPAFYGGTYCVGCARHRPVNEFVWDGTDERVGS